ncbi:hypothetical protein Harman_41780 [Haloarcula mannanilytica]|uniref:Type II methyltransferase n=2 Tax=Haloarcula mannanilytica TaxID=2509225 RepID=A0A4C2EUC2_9EURY|nr:hypothetical protein Harman_41780 [Haloarcula mannanilytica]
MILTDPPYNISSDFEISFDDRKDISHDFGDWDYGQVQPSDWIGKATRVLTDTGVFISMYDDLNMGRMISSLRQQGLEIREKVYWHKDNPVPQFHGVKWQRAVEEMVVATVNEGEGHHFQANRGQRHNVIKTPICQGRERRNHPTQKPRELFRPIIKWWTTPGDILLDPFTGTGTIPVVAQEHGRHYIGIEQNKKYVKTARKRLSQTSLRQNW